VMEGCNGWTWDTRAKLYRKAIDAWGLGAQLLMVVEEMSELAKAILKLARAEDKAQAIISVMEETADVEIMLEQLRIILMDMSEVARPARTDTTPVIGVDSIKAQKLARLAERLGIPLGPSVYVEVADG